MYYFLIFVILSACGLCCEALCKLAIQIKCIDILIIVVKTSGFIHEIIMATKLHWCDVSPCWLIYFFVRPTLVRNGIEYYNDSKDYKPLSDIQTYCTYSITFKCILDKGLYL